MTLMQFVAQALTTLAPVVLLALAVVGSRLSEALRKRVQNERLRQLLDTIGKLVATGVADAYQTIVQALKDTSKPGEWDEAAARYVKAKVISEVKSAAPDIMRQLTEVGIEELDSLLHRLVEQEVVKLNNAVKKGEILETIVTPVVIAKEGNES
jgi:hypothetical protein